ncbi:MAG TPA: ATP-dependent DNA helicase, partial [Actinomycetota bacterium]|nr:ATP-dependent DNA helicase [Actinomycetota bacterium]
MAPHPFEPDPDQLRVLEHERGPLLVLGAAGTGKTLVLRERFARLVEGGADPERIALVTRSKRDRVAARADLLDRLATPLPSVRVFTTHALAFHVLGLRYAVLGYTEPPRVLSATDQFARVRALLQDEDPGRWGDLGSLLPLRGFADEVRHVVLRAQEALLGPEDILGRAEDARLAAWRGLGVFYDRYLKTMAAEGAVDFAGLVAQAARAVADGATPFDHVLVDDYQDTTISFERLVTGLRAPDLVVAGNPDAHVFSFQGTTDVPLGRLSEALTAPVTTLGMRHRGEASLEGWRAPHVSEELAAVARELRRTHVEDDVPWGRLAAITRRQGSQTAALVRALDDAGIPHTGLDAGIVPGGSPATVPYLLALRWLIAADEERDELVEAVLTSELGGLSPAAARGLLRSARAHGRPPRDALALDAGLSASERDSLERLRPVLERARSRAASVLDAFGVLWRDLACSARLVSAAETDPEARADLDAVVALARAVEDAGNSADTSIEPFLAGISAREGGPELAGQGEDADDAVHVLTAHGVAGLEFDTVFVVGAVEGNFPSLSRPEPMFDLTTLDAGGTRSQINRARLADERRLFGLVLDRATRRVVLTVSEPEGEDPGVAAPTRFAEERAVLWRRAPVAPFAAPVSTTEAASTWRRVLADPLAPAPERLACLDGLIALGADPSTWWFQLDWSGAEATPADRLHLSYSRLSNLENCELQYVLANELGLDTGSGHKAWIGHLIHSIIEECEEGRIERTPQAFVEQIDRRWQESQFPSHAVSEAERSHATQVLVPNWFERYGDLPATANERDFRFELDGAAIRGRIDRIGPAVEGGTRITDFKTGRADKAGPAAENLQLGVYYLAVHECEELAEYRPIDGVELAFLGGRGSKTDLTVVGWPVGQDVEEDYKQRMRDRLTGLIARIRELDASGRYVPSTAADCYFCGFRTLCSRYPEGNAVFPITEGGGTSDPEMA